MNDDQAVILRIYQYLLSKEVILKQDIVYHESFMHYKKVRADDVFTYWLLLYRLKCWEEFAGDLLKLLQ